MIVPASLNYELGRRGAVVNAQIASPYLLAAEAAAYVRTTIQGIYSLVKRGRLKPMPGSGKLLFTREALDDYLKKRRPTH